MKTLSFFAFGILFFFSGFSLLAQEPTTSTPAPKKTQEVRATKVQERVTAAAERAEEKAQKQAETQQMLMERKKSALLIAKEKLKLLDSLWARVQARIEKMKSQGQNLSSLDALVADVAVKKKAAEDAIAATEEALHAQVTVTPVKKPVKELRANIVPALRAYHQSIVSVITKLMSIHKVEKTKTPIQTPTVTPAAL